MSKTLPEPRIGKFVARSPSLRGNVFSARGLMAAVAILTCLAMAHEMIHLTSEPVYVTVSAVVGSFFALGAMRKPWFFLVIWIVVWMTFPRISDSSADSMLGATYTLSTLLGALAGWIIRGQRMRTQKHVNDPDESTP